MGDDNDQENSSSKQAPAIKKASNESNTEEIATTATSTPATNNRIDGNGIDTTDGQTSVLTNSCDMVGGTANTNMQSPTGTGNCNARAPSASWLRQTHEGVSLEPTAHLSCSGKPTASNAAAGTQVGLQQQQQVNDREMAIVSESMAHASLTPPTANEQRSEGAVAERAASGKPKEGEKESKMTVIVIPAMTPCKAKSQEATKSRKKKRSPPAMHPGQSSGRWTHAEHEAFLEGLKLFGREWKKVAVRIPTRTSAQVRSHAQKALLRLAREQSEANVEAGGLACAASSAASTGGSSAASTAAEAMAAAQSHPPEVQRNVERILANPEQAQRDVEDTLRALRERYLHLQQRLREHQAQNNRPGSPSNQIEEEKEDSNNSEQQGNVDQQNHQQRQGKRRRGGGNGDDCSMSSSTLSSLGNEELIALSVLGATLPNGGGGAAPPPAADAEAPGHARQQSSSSLESNSSNSSNTSKSSKRKRDKGA